MGNTVVGNNVGPNVGCSEGVREAIKEKWMQNVLEKNIANQTPYSGRSVKLTQIGRIDGWRHRRRAGNRWQGALKRGRHK